MAFQPANDVAQIQIEYIAGALNAQNTMYFHKDGGWTELSLQALAEDVVEAWEANVAPVTSNDWALLQVVATNMEETSGLKQIWRPATTIPGTVAIESLPPNVSMAIKFQVPRRGRGINGRVFAVGIPSNLDSLGYLSSVGANGLANAWRDMAGEVETNSDCQHVVLHRVEGGIRTPTATPESVVGYTISDLALDSQKLRLPNHKKAKRIPAAP